MGDPHRPARAADDGDALCDALRAFAAHDATEALAARVSRVPSRTTTPEAGPDEVPVAGRGPIPSTGASDVAGRPRDTPAPTGRPVGAPSPPPSGTPRRGPAPLGAGTDARTRALPQSTEHRRSASVPAVAAAPPTVRDGTAALDRSGPGPAAPPPASPATPRRDADGGGGTRGAPARAVRRRGSRLG